MTRSEHSMLEELVSRARRVETRLTSYLIDIGAHTSAAHNQPTWVTVDGNSVIAVPGLDVTLSACLRAVPEGRRGRISIVHEGTVIAVLNA